MRIRIPSMGRFFSLGSEKFLLLMREKEWSQYQAAAELAKEGFDTDPGNLNRWAHGHRRPSLLAAIAIAKLGRRFKHPIPEDSWAKAASKKFRLERDLTQEDKIALATGSD